VRDAERTLGECLDSLATQTLAAHEVIAVDDGSRDQSRELLAERARHDARLRLIATPARGLPSALNTALGAARAPLVARMDADDVAYPERLAAQLERFGSEPGLAILGCRVELLSEAGLANQGMRDYVAWLNGLLDHTAIVRDLFVESPLVHPSVMLRAEALRALGGWRDFDGPEDYDLWLRSFEAGLRFGKVDQLLLGWRDRAKRLTRRDPRYGADRFRRLKLEALVRGPLRSGRGVVVWGAGPIGKTWARDLVGRGVDVAAFAEVDPRKIGHYINGIAVLSVAEAAGLRGPLHLAAVGQRGARQTIRSEAARFGLLETRDLVAVA
jgi:glycosyltransferase involved in cell wall biosynthesis